MSIASMGRRDYLSPSERSVNTLPRLVGKGANGRKQPLRAIVQPCDLAHLAPQTSRILVQALQVDLEWRTVTEIPEHLLKRSKERRGALAGETGDAAPAAPAASAPAVAKAAPVAAAPAAPPPPKPDPAYVTAAKTRKKIPFWAWQLSACFLCGRLFIFWHCNRESKQLKDHLQSVLVFMDRAQDATAQQAKAEQDVHLQMVKC